MYDALKDNNVCYRLFLATIDKEIEENFDGIFVKKYIYVYRCIKFGNGIRLSGISEIDDVISCISVKVSKIISLSKCFFDHMNNPFYVSQKYCIGDSIRFAEPIF